MSGWFELQETEVELVPGPEGDRLVEALDELCSDDSEVSILASATHVSRFQFSFSQNESSGGATTILDALEQLAPHLVTGIHLVGEYDHEDIDYWAGTPEVVAAGQSAEALDRTLLRLDKLSAADFSTLQAAVAAEAFARSLSEVPA
jgi:hypothetical protein